MSKMGRPKLAEEELKIRKTIHIEPEIFEWIKTNAGKRSGDFGRFVNEKLRPIMNKEKTTQ